MGFEDDIARTRVEQGADNPYDAPDNWRLNGVEMRPPNKPKDWAHAAARGVMAEMSDRTGVRATLAIVPEDVRAELVASLADIIKYASDQHRPMLRRAVEDERNRITGLLTGIDATEVESPKGWWETSAGAAFGGQILNSIRQGHTPDLADEDDNTATEETMG